MAGRVGSNLQSTPAVNCMKFLLMVFNFIFWVSGIAILALGVWMKVELHKYIGLTVNYNEWTALVLMLVGASIVIVGSLGCLCTMKGKSSMLYLYACFLMVVFVAELVVAIAAFVLRGKFEEGFDEGLKEAMKVYSSNDEKKEAIDGLQKKLHCCGHDSYEDWFTVDWDTKGASKSVPESCCIEKGCKNTDLPTGNATTVYTAGCYALVTQFAEENFGIIGGVGIGFALLQLFGAMLSCCLAKHINKNKYEQVA